MAELDTYNLPPTQSLALEVLAARYRLGETLWTFSARHRPALEGLQERGLVSLMHGIVERTCRASLTDAGREAVLLESYEPPEVRRLRGVLAQIPPDRLEKLADWFDADDEMKMTLFAERPDLWPRTWQYRSSGVQADLRRWAALLREDGDS